MLTQPKLAPSPTPLPVVRPATLVEAVRRHWILVVVPALLCLAGAIAFGFAREPNYTAESRLVVGQVDSDTGGLSGFVATTQSLATAYSRAIDAPGVTRPVSRATRVKADNVPSHLSASAIPE